MELGAVVERERAHRPRLRSDELRETRRHLGRAAAVELTDRDEARLPLDERHDAPLLTDELLDEGPLRLGEVRAPPRDEREALFAQGPNSVPFRLAVRFALFL